MANFQNWNYFNRNVQSGLTDGQFLSSGSVLICAGPPSLGVGGVGQVFEQDGNAAVGDVVYPIGLIQSWSLNQQIPVIPVPEAGSHQRYTVTGPSDGSLALGRTLYHGPSLLRVLYAYYRARANASIPIDPLIDDNAANLLRNPHNYVNDAPGYENLWLNMGSSLLSQPVGIMLYFQDTNRESYGCIYLEGFHASGHGIASGPGQLLLNEQVQGPFRRCRAVRVANPIPLMSRLSLQEDLNDEGVTTVAGSDRTTGGTQRVRTQNGSNL